MLKYKCRYRYIHNVLIEEGRRKRTNDPSQKRSFLEITTKFSRKDSPMNVPNGQLKPQMNLKI